MNEMDLYGIPRKVEKKLEIEAWAKAENMEMVLGQDELWSRRYGVSTKKKKPKMIVTVRIRHGIAYGLHWLANHVEPNEYVRSKGLVTMSQI